MQRGRLIHAQHEADNVAPSWWKISVRWHGLECAKRRGETNKTRTDTAAIKVETRASTLAGTTMSAFADDLHSIEF